MFQHLLTAFLAFSWAASTALAQAPKPTLQPPVSTSVPLLEIKLVVDPSSGPSRRYSVERPELPVTSPLLRSLSWKVLINGREDRSVSAISSTQLEFYTTTSGKYTAYLTASSQGRYERVSNIIELQIDLDPKSKPVIPPGAIIRKAKAGAASGHATLEAKDLLKLELKKRGDEYTVTRPELPTSWKNAGWVVTRDGKQVLEARADPKNPIFTPCLAGKGTYEVFVRAWVNGRYMDVSERVKFRVVR